MNTPNAHSTVDLSGKRMFVAQTADGGEVSRETIFKFQQDGDLVSGRYEGGRIRLGLLVGLMYDNRLEFRYVQTDADGNLDAGKSVCDIRSDDKGRLILHETFEWATRPGGGINILEEIAED